MGDIFRIALAIFQRLADFRQAFGDIARHARGFLRGIEGMRFLPDFCQPFANGRFTQIFEIDPKALAIWKLVVSTSCAGEIRVNLERVADVAGDDERWCGMIGVEQKHIGLRLLASVLHHHIPAARDAAPAELFGLCVEQGKLAGDGLLLARKTRLLRLQYEAVSLVEIDAFWRRAPVALARTDSALEYVIIELSVTT